MSKPPLESLICSDCAVYNVWTASLPVMEVGFPQSENMKINLFFSQALGGLVKMRNGSAISCDFELQKTLHLAVYVPVFIRK